MAAIGIDLGSENCVIAQAKRGGIDVLLNQASNRKNALMVSFQGKQRFVGESAVTLARNNYKNTVSCFKRFIGRKFNDPDVQEEIKKFVHSKMVALENGNVGAVVNYDGEDRVMSMEMLMAMMLMHLRDLAKAAIGQEIVSAVLSVPGFWTDVQRRGLLDAVGIAGLNVSSLMNETTATALAYGIYKNARKEFDASVPKNVMFLDCGHTSFSVSIVSFIENKLIMKSQAYDRLLGGRDFTDVLVKMAAEEFKKKTKLDVYTDPKALIKLEAAVEKAKQSLSPIGVKDSRLNVECLMNDIDFNMLFVEPDFIANSQHLLPRMELAINKALDNAGMAAEDLSTVEIVGGGSRVGWIKEYLAKCLKLDLSKINYGLATTMNADEAVARGCALQCAILSPLFKVKEFHISDTIYLPVRLSWEQVDAVDKDGDEFSSNSITLFQKNDEYPKMQRLTFRRKKEFELTAAYEEKTQANGDIPARMDLTIAKFKVTGLPKELLNPEEAPRIRVFIQTDRNGIVSASSARLIQEVVKSDEEAKEGAAASETKSEADTNMSTELAEGEAKSETTTSAEAKEGESKTEDEKKVAKKKNTKKVETDLKVDTVCSSLPNKVISDAIEEVLKMEQQDRIIRETNDKRNELEAYIYKMRDEIDDRFKAYASAADKEAIAASLSGAEEWLYSDEAYCGTKGTFQTKLDELAKTASPMVTRESELKQLPGAMATLGKDIEYFLSRISSSELDHLTSEEKNKVQTECNVVQTWLTEQKAAQDVLATTEDPAVTTSQVQAKGKTLYYVCNPIVTKAKPKPPAPKPKEEEKTESKTEAESKDVDMNADGDAKKEEAEDVKMDPDLD